MQESRRVHKHNVIPQSVQISAGLTFCSCALHFNAIKLRQKGGKMGRRERQKWGEEEMNKVKELIKANR